MLVHKVCKHGLPIVIKQQCSGWWIVRVSTQATWLYSQPTQARNLVHRVPPSSYHSVFSCERKHRCSQKTSFFPSPSMYMHVSKALTLTQTLIPDPARRETYSIHTERFQYLSLLLSGSEPQNLQHNCE